MDGIKAFGFAFGKVCQTQPTNGEARLFDLRENLARDALRHGVGLDDGKCAFSHIRAILSRSSPGLKPGGSNGKARGLQRQSPRAPTAKPEGSNGKARGLQRQSPRAPTA